MRARAPVQVACHICAAEKLAKHSGSSHSSVWPTALFSDYGKAAQVCDRETSYSTEST